MDGPIPRQRRYSENLFDPEPTFRFATPRPVLPQRHRGLPPEAPLPPGADLGRLRERMRELAPGGWCTDDRALAAAVAALRASLDMTTSAGGGDDMSEVSVEPETAEEPEAVEGEEPDASAEAE